MKKLKNLLFVFASILVLLSCSNDDDGSSTDNAIVGTWEITEINFNSQEDGIVVTDQTFSTDVCNAPFFFTFESGGDLSLSNVELEFEIDFDDEPILICQVDNGVLPGNWSNISGNNYVITVENEPSQAEITFSNNNTTIEIIVIEEFTDDIDDITYTDTVTFRGNLN